MFVLVIHPIHHHIVRRLAVTISYIHNYILNFILSETQLFRFSGIQRGIPKKRKIATNASTCISKENRQTGFSRNDEEEESPAPFRFLIVLLDYRVRLNCPFICN
jgi:hypothetical protein